jgi:cytochrome c biogenesis protein CcdA
MQIHPDCTYASNCLVKVRYRIDSKEVSVVAGLLALIGLGFALGLRHGIDWDHIAAITDITSSTVTNEETEAEGRLVVAGAGGPGVGVGLHVGIPSSTWHESRQGFWLASLYALGHASVVAVLGLLAIWLGTILPEWVDPLMERIVGVTLLVLGAWIFYSIWRYGRSFQLKSRWMLVFALAAKGWVWLKHTISRHPTDHTHNHRQDIAQYGPRAALGIGMIHGIGAETGSQALLLASAAGATTALTGTLILFAFVVGLLISNSIIAIFSLVSFASSGTKRNIYVAIGILAGIFSLVVGFYFIAGQGSELPDLQELLNAPFGLAR